MNKDLLNQLNFPTLLLSHNYLPSKIKAIQLSMSSPNMASKAIICNLGTVRVLEDLIFYFSLALINGLKE